MYNREEFKTEARRLRAHIASKHGLELSIGHALEAIAVVHNYPNWDAASASASGEQPDNQIEPPRPYKEVQIIVSDDITTAEVYRQVCYLTRCNPDHFAFLVEENDKRPRADWDKIFDVITQSEISFSRTYVTAEYLTMPSI